MSPEPEPGTYLFGIKRDPASRGGSRYIHDELKVGKTLTISPPRNNFPLEENAEATIMLAGGIGITPIWCMVQRLEDLGHPWRLYYCGRSRADMAFLETLEGMELENSAVEKPDAPGNSTSSTTRTRGGFSISPGSSAKRPGRRISTAAGRLR